ncbi:hypothetical protein J3E69DRAFT_364444 [Trichoderma sp. SZMC 28015]
MKTSGIAFTIAALAIGSLAIPNKIRAAGDVAWKEASLGRRGAGDEAWRESTLGRRGAGDEAWRESILERRGAGDEA